MVFQRRNTAAVSLDSPQSMFRDFSGRKVPGVLDYQGAVLDSYLAHGLEEKNVAVQLPTGSGKTLIGLLIAEWRRLNFGERAVYLCPTNQLAKQVEEHATQKYGMRVARFRGKKNEYGAEEKADYESSRCIAVTSYSALFNSNPYFHDANFIVLDDAHVADNYIASPWSLQINAGEHSEIFERVSLLLKQVLSPAAYQSLTQPVSGYFERSWADLLPVTDMLSIHTQLKALLDQLLDGTRLFHTWSMIRSNMLACTLYLGQNELLLRPLIPPTEEFAPFANARQRLFMSATLGEAGNFQRMTGVRSVCRLPTPTQLEKQGIGRRFFIFPGQSLDESAQSQLSFDLMQQANRSVALVPSKASAAKYSFSLAARNFKVFTIEGLEDDKSSFNGSDNSVALLAGRYDGLDFPDDDARLLIIDGMPMIQDLQEAFMRNKANASTLLGDRVRSRVVQAVGRCTRSQNDYSAVVVLDDKLVRYFRVEETRTLLPLEMQAEVLFGLEQGRNRDVDYRVQFTALVEHQENWEVAESEIRAFRSDAKIGHLVGDDEYSASVAAELDFVYSLWNARYPAALSAAKSVCDALHADENKGYRAFWQYQAAIAALLATNFKHGEFSDQYRHLLTQASKGLANVDWLLRLAGVSLLESSEIKPSDSAQILVERLASRLERLGISSNATFAQKIEEISNGLSQSDAVPFEMALVELGTLLGFDSGKIEEEGTPDPWWRVDPSLCFVFEAHSSGTSGKIGSAKTRQAALQHRYISKKLAMDEGGRVFSVLISDGKPSSEAASIYLDGTSLWNLTDFRSWASALLSMVQELRNAYSLSGDLMWRMRAADLYVANGIDPQSLMERWERDRWHHPS